MQGDWPLCKHGNRVCSKCIVVTDAAKRISDTINLLITFNYPFELRTKWLAFRLEDGVSPGMTLYDSRADAINHMSNPKYYAYFCLGSCLGGAKALDCQIWLNMQRHAYDNGLGFEEPKAPQLILPTSIYDRWNGIRRGR